MLQLGIVTPVVHMNPRFDPPSWEVTGTLEDILAVARATDELGYGWVSCSEHIAVPVDATSIRGGRYWDPITTLAVISTVTDRVGLLTHMLVLPYHHPLEVVKRLGTLDVVSDGRVILGVGVGSLEPEFRVLGHEYEGRGARSDDAIRAIKAAWGTRIPTYDGTHYSFADFVVEPSGKDRPLSVWVGGRTVRSLRRAIELGDAWMPFRLTLPELDSILSRPDIVALLEQRGARMEFIFAPEPPIDPLGTRDATTSVFRSYLEAGATGLSLRFRNDSRSHYIEQMAAAMDIARELGE